MSSTPSTLAAFATVPNPHDYITTEESLDRNEAECAQLRSLGVPAACVPIRRQRELFDAFTDRVERAAMEAWDELAKEHCGEGEQGWKDQDLPDLLPAIRAHAARLWCRKVGYFILKAESEKTAKN